MRYKLVDKDFYGWTKGSSNKDVTLGQYVDEHEIELGVPNSKSGPYNGGYLSTKELLRLGFTLSEEDQKRHDDPDEIDKFIGLFSKDEIVEDPTTKPSTTIMHSPKKNLVALGDKTLSLDSHGQPLIEEGYILTRLAFKEITLQQAYDMILAMKVGK